MASEWEAMGLDLGMGVRQHNTAMPPPPSMSHLYGGGPGDLPFFPPGGEAPPPASSAGSFNLSFADDFSIPTMQSEEAAELEWLSNFIDDSSYPDIPNYPPEVAAAAQQMNNNKPAASAATTGARTKRSRAATWLLPSSSSSSSQQQQQISSSSSGGKKQPPAVVDEEVRRCTHCASEKTPQWRTGPMGPKTLCNACGVRYKSGRLVPEYRPAASPTFVLTQHSNSHRKVMELRRQKEQQLLHLHHAASSGSSSFRDYGVC